MSRPIVRFALLAVVTSITPACMDFYHGLKDPTTSSNAAAPKVLVRGFATSSRPPEGFGYYAYLVFADDGAATLPQRKRAARAMLGLFDAVERVELSSNNLLGIPRNELALLLTPLRWWNVSPPETATEVLASYDYDAACTIYRQVGSLGKPVPTLALVGAAQPIVPGARLDAGSVFITDLCTTERIEQKMHDLELRLTGRQPEITLVARVRALFESLGEFMSRVPGNPCTDPPAGTCEGRGGNP